MQCPRLLNEVRQPGRFGDPTGRPYNVSWQCLHEQGAGHGGYHIFQEGTRVRVHAS